MPNGDYEISGVYRPDDPREPGAYEVKGDGETSGICAGCLLDVREGEPFVIRYSLSHAPGGIFHARCAPTGVEWYGVDGDEDDEC